MSGSEPANPRPRGRAALEPEQPSGVADPALPGPPLPPRHWRQFDAFRTLPELRDLPESVAMQLYAFAYDRVCRRRALAFWTEVWVGLILGLAVPTLAAVGLVHWIGPAYAVRAVLVSFLSGLGIAGWMVAFSYWLFRRTRRAVRVEIAELRLVDRLPYCLHCDYDLRGTTGATCPECGAPIAAAAYRQDGDGKGVTCESPPNSTGV